MSLSHNEFGRPEIPSAELTYAMVPVAGAVYHTEVIEFALTFSGYSYYPKNLAKIAQHAARNYQEKGKLPRTLNRLRGCLFFQQRFWRNDGGDPDEASMAFISAILEAIRVKIRTNATTPQEEDETSQSSYK